MIGLDHEQPGVPAFEQDVLEAPTAHVHVCEPPPVHVASYDVVLELDEAPLEMALGERRGLGVDTPEPPVVPCARSVRRRDIDTCARSADMGDLDLTPLEADHVDGWVHDEQCINERARVRAAA
jgi:hypothetical protein